MTGVTLHTGLYPQTHAIMYALNTPHILLYYSHASIRTELGLSSQACRNATCAVASRGIVKYPVSGKPCGLFN